MDRHGEIGARGLSGLFSALLLTLVSGCGAMSADGFAAEGAKTAAKANSGPPKGLEPLFKGLGTPDTVLVFSGELQGYLEPCGCSENQSGGLARRADLFQQMWGKSWHTAAFDVGGDLNAKRLSYQQSLLKEDFLRKALAEMRYSGMALGQEELRLGGDQLFELFSEWSSADRFVPFVSANVTILSTREIGTPKEYVAVDVGGRHIVATAVIGKSKLTPELKGKDVDESILKIDDAEKSLETLMPRLIDEKPDLLILLAHAEDDEAAALAQRFPQFQIVVTAGGPEDPELKSRHVGSTLLVQVGRKGKYVACVGLSGAKRNPSLSFEMVELDRHRFENAKQMTDLMREYQQRIIAEHPDAGFTLVPKEPGTFVGVDQCKDCHQKAYDVWIKTGHATALASLTEGRPEEKPEWKVDRQFDPECLACHVTGWSPQDALRYKSGFVSLKETPQLANQQCENCHGPGSVHVAAELAFQKTKNAPPDLESARAEMRETRACDECHDHDNSPHFEYDKYWHGGEGLIGVEH
jgi:hypothetical protein